MASMTVEENFWYERLSEGTLLRSHDTWVNQVPFPDLYEEYQKYVADTKGTKQLSRQKFGGELKKLCKKIRDTRPAGTGKRPAERIFPPLDACRKEFEQRVGIDAKTLWGDKGDTDATGPNDPTNSPMQ